jgi:hypothetical protein
MIELVKVLEQKEIQKALFIVDSLKDHYEPLSEGYNFETLGAASYLHYGNEHENYKQSGKKYHAIKERSNPILIKNFDWLYQILINKISEVLKEPCDISKEAGLAFPGFHIFYPYDPYEKICHPAHFDYQWSYHIDSLEEKYKKIDKVRFLTFTLSIELPHNGAGLYYWDLPNDKQYSFNEAEDLMKDTLDQIDSLFQNSEQGISKEIYEEKLKPSILNYKEGYMSIFTQPILHQITPFNAGWKKEDKRVTLQGHGIKCDNIWRLYF